MLQNLPLIFCFREYHYSNIENVFYQQIILSGNHKVAENSPSRSYVGTLSSVDVNSDDTHIYAIIPAAACAGKFEIISDRLYTLVVFDYEAGPKRLVFWLVVSTNIWFKHGAGEPFSSTACPTTPIGHKIFHKPFRLCGQLTRPWSELTLRYLPTYKHNTYSV